MTDGQEASQESSSTPIELTEESRRVAATVVAAAAIGWWPAFTFGAYGVIFFDQRMSLWVVATSAFIVLGVVRGVQVWRRKRVLSLLLPSLWLLITWLLPTGVTSPASSALFWFGAILTIFGMPAMAAYLLRLVIPEVDRLQGRQAVAAIGVVVVIMAASFGLGTQHPHLLTCGDFTVSGNYAPEGCTPGPVPTGAHR